MELRNFIGQVLQDHKEKWKKGKSQELKQRFVRSEMRFRVDHGHKGEKCKKIQEKSLDFSHLGHMT